MLNFLRNWRQGDSKVNYSQPVFFSSPVEQIDIYFGFFWLNMVELKSLPIIEHLYDAGKSICLKNCPIFLFQLFLQCQLCKIS